MVKVDTYNSRTWNQDKATYRLGSALLAVAISSILLIFLAFQGIAGMPSNYGLALSAILLIMIGLFAGFVRPKIDDYYKVAPRPVWANHPQATAIAAALVYLAIGVLNRVVIVKELASLTGQTAIQQIAILGGSAINENLLIEYFAMSALFAALILIFKSYWFSFILSWTLSSAIAWINHYAVYLLDPNYFIFVFGSFMGMGLLYWLYGSVMLTIAIHFWWNDGGLIWQTLGLPSVNIPGGCLPYCTTSIIQPSFIAGSLVSALVFMAGLWFLPSIHKLGGHIRPVTGGMA